MDLVLRTTGTPAVGGGHVMRCAALAEAWRAAGLGGAVLWGEVTVPYAQRRLERLQVRCVDAAPAGEAVLVCDNYDLAVRGEVARHSPAALRVLVDDVGGDVPSGYDVVWNPNAYGSAALYPGFGGTVFGGTEWMAVRTELPAWRGNRSGPIAVMLGGSTLAPALVDGLRRFGEQVGVPRVVASGAWVPDGWARLPDDQPWNAIADASLLITSAGTTIWEMACAGIPAVPVRIADNQDLIFAWATAAGAPGVDVLALGDADRIAAALVRASGAARVLPPIRNGASAVAQRLATMARTAGLRS